MYSNKKNIFKVFALALILFTPLSQATNSIYFDPNPSNFNLDDGVGSLELFMEFSESTLGGSVDLDFTGAISFKSFTRSTNWGSVFDNGTSGDNSTQADADYQINIANFAGFSGKNSIGIVDFYLNSEGVGGILLTHNTLFGGFLLNDGNFTNLMTVDLMASQVNVSAIPVPAALWLMLSGVASLGAFGSRGKKA